MMKILSANQIRQWDVWTIEKTPIASVDLMEKASTCFANWFQEECSDIDRPVLIFCGPGNNGGDGLVIARLLLQQSYKVKVYCCKTGNDVSDDFAVNLIRLQDVKRSSIFDLEKNNSLPAVPKNAYVIDAIFGTGLNRAVEGLWAKIIDHLNQSGSEIISVDLPSGMFADQATSGSAIHATKTFSFQTPRLAFFFAENHHRVGDWFFGSIGLLPDFLEQISSDYFYTTEKDIQNILKPRSKFSHKGSYGHALLVAGSMGMAGAAILAAKACLRSGVGLLSVHIPSKLGDILQVSVPEAMLSIDPDKKQLSALNDTSQYKSIGIGPGLGKEIITSQFLSRFLKETKQALVLDADALNIIAAQPELLNHIPQGSILTPHPKEFERLFGLSNNDFERNEKQRNISTTRGIIIVLKGAHTAITTPEGCCYFNGTGNPGMATAGSGDVLTGIMTGLLAQSYTSKEAAILGAWLHGLAGDLAAEKFGEASLLASDIIANIGAAYLELKVH